MSSKSPSADDRKEIWIRNDLPSLIKYAGKDVPAPPSEDVMEPNEKTPEGASSQTLRLNTDNYNVIFDTLKDHALKLVANAHGEMSLEQWEEWINEHTTAYAQAIASLILDARIDEVSNVTHVDESAKWTRDDGQHMHGLLVTTDEGWLLVSERLSALEAEKQQYQSKGG